MTTPLRLAVFVALAAVLAGCPGRTRRLGGEPPVPQSGDARARERFEELRARFKQDDARAEEFARIATDYPDDPIAPHATLYAGVAQLQAGDHAAAVKTLEPVSRDGRASAEVRARAQLFLGVALGYRGEHARALTALEAGAGTVDSGSPDEQATFHAAMAEAAAGVGRRPVAIAHYDAWYATGRPAERAYALARLRALVGTLTHDEARALFAEVGERKGPAAALVGGHLAGLYAAAGERDAAAEVRARSAEARAALGMAREGAGGAGGQSGKVGAILPLSGKRSRIGDASLRGLALAAGAAGDAAGPAFPRPFALEVEDDRSTSAAAGGAIERLASDEVIAVVGPVDGHAVERASARADALGLPLLSLSPAANLIHTGGASVFHVVHSAEQRAVALARHALATGARDFAILRPQNRFGEEIGRAFADAVRAGGGKVVVEQGYPPEATAFTAPVGKLKRSWQVLFVPDGAAKLELIAPALAAANLVARPAKAKVKSGRAIQLYALGDLAAPRFLRSAGRYAEGAVLAPGFFPDPADPGAAGFAEAYQRAFGSAPTAPEAYAFDAALLVRKAVEAGARSRGDVVDWLAGARVHGLTGDIAFDASRRRADAGVLYQVAKIAADQYELRPTR